MGMSMSDRAKVTYTEEERNTALQVWAFLADRKPGRTADILQDEYGIAVPAKRIGEWARNYDWHAKTQELYRDTAPGMFDQTRFTLTAAGPVAARYLYDVVAGVAEPDKVRASVSLGIVDRLGFLPFASRDKQQPSPIASGTSSPQLDTGTSADLSGLDLDRLRELAAGTLDAE